MQTHFHHLEERRKQEKRREDVVQTKICYNIPGYIVHVSCVNCLCVCEGGGGEGVLKYHRMKRGREERGEERVHEIN